MKTKLGANTPTITLSEAVTWVAYGKKFYSREDVNKWYRSNRSNRGRLPQAIQKKLDTAGDQVVHLMINGVSARGNWQGGDDPPSDSREAVQIDFLKDGVFAQAANDSIYADPEKESHSGAYHSVELDLREFFAALGVPLAEVQEDAPAQTLPPHDEPDPQTDAENVVPQYDAREGEQDALDDAGDGIDRSRIRPIEFTPEEQSKGGSKPKFRFGLLEYLERLCVSGFAADFRKRSDITLGEIEQILTAFAKGGPVKDLVGIIIDDFEHARYDKIAKTLHWEDWMQEQNDNPKMRQQALKSLQPYLDIINGKIPLPKKQDTDLLT